MDFPFVTQFPGITIQSTPWANYLAPQKGRAFVLPPIRRWKCTPSMHSIFLFIRKICGFFKQINHSSTSLFHSGFKRKLLRKMKRCHVFQGSREKAVSRVSNLRKVSTHTKAANSHIPPRPAALIKITEVLHLFSFLSIYPLHLPTLKNVRTGFLLHLS